MAEAPEAMIEKAQSSLAVGDAASAQASLNQVLQSYPRHPQALLRRGFVRVRLGDLGGAVDDWEQAVEVEPALIKSIDSAELRPVVEASLQTIKQLVSRDPSNLSLQILLGRAYASFGRYAQALQGFTSILRLAPEEIQAGLGSAQVYLRLGQTDQALAVLQKLYELHPNDGDLCYRIGSLYMKVNSVVQATRFFERACALNPDDWRSNLELGQIFVRQGRHEQATARFQKTLQIKSDCAPALVGLAECCKELYRFEAAISYYQQAIAVDPGDYKALCQMGSLCIQLGGLDLGIETLLRGLDINQNDVEIYSSLAKAYQQKGDLPTAARYFARTVELNPKDYFAAYNLGLIYRSQGQISQAADAFGMAAQLRPNDSQYQYQSSRALLELGQVAAALDAAQKAVALNPHSKESQLLFGRCCLEAGNFSSAAEAFRQAVHIDAQNVEAHYQLAVSLLNLQQIDEARASFQTVLRLSPQHAPSQLGLGHVARKTGQWQTAADHYRQAIQLDLTLAPAILELTRLYLERNQQDSILEFIRQMVLSRKSDHRIPAEFLRDWLLALESQQRYDLAEEALDFIGGVYPHSAPVKDNQRGFRLRTAQHFLNRQDFERTRAQLQQLDTSHPGDAEAKALRSQLEELESRSYSSPDAPADLFETAPLRPQDSHSDRLGSLDDPLWEPLDLEPRPSRSGELAPPPLEDPPGPTGLEPPPPLSPPPSGILPPPPLDDLDLGESSTLESFAPDPTLLSRLAVEDVRAGQNTFATPQSLASLYIELAQRLEKEGWLKQASLFLIDARNLDPGNRRILPLQVRLLQQWSARLEQEADQEGAQQLSRWSETLSRALPEDVEMWEAPPVPQVEPVEPVEPVESVEPEPPAPLAAPAEETWAPQPEIPAEPVAEVEPEPEVEPSPFLTAPLAPQPEVAEAPSTGRAGAELALAAPSDPVEEVESQPFQPSTEPAPAVSDLASFNADATRPPNEIAEWMRSFQDTAAHPPASSGSGAGLIPSDPTHALEEEDEEDEEPEEEEAPAEPELQLSGQETVEDLVQLLSQRPYEKKVRSALYLALSDDVPGLLKIFRELSQEYADEPYHVLNLARAYAHTGSDSLAVLQYRKYVKMEATAEGYQELGQIYERMGKAELASQAYKRAEQLA